MDSTQIEQFIQQPDAPNLYWALATLPVAKVVLLHAVRLYEELGGDHFKWMPAEFRSPKSKAAQGLTNYVVPVGIGSIFEEGFNVAMCDGSVHLIHKTIEPKNLKALITRASGEPFNSQDF